MGERGERGKLAADDIARLRARLRLTDPTARSESVVELKAWQGAGLAEGAAPAVLSAATVGYPWVDSVPDDPGELLVQLLWQDPRGVPTGELERAYVFCAEKARRAILRTLALRRDAEAIDALVHLLGLDGPVDLLPVPTEDLLRPLVDVPGVERLVGVLVATAWRRGWVPVVVDVVGAVLERGLLSDSEAREACVELAPLMTSLVDTCDRAATMSDRGAMGRADRERAALLTPIFGEIRSEESLLVLRRVLASADPKLAASAAVALARRGEVVGEDRVALIARDPEARRLLLGGLSALGRGFELPDDLRSEVAIAESDVVSYLAGRKQLGAPPDEIEHRGVFATPLEWGRGITHLFAFRVRAPHWSSQRGWMLAAAGPFEPSSEFMPQRSEGFEVCSLYESEDCGELARHLLDISRAVVAARTQGSDGRDNAA